MKTSSDKIYRYKLLNDDANTFTLDMTIFLTEKQFIEMAKIGKYFDIKIVKRKIKKG
jgi:hypothetical protein